MHLSARFLYTAVCLIVALGSPQRVCLAQLPLLVRYAPLPVLGFRTLTTAAEVKRLNSERASPRYPVKITGVTTYVEPGSYSVIQDDTAAVLLNHHGRNHSGTARLGELVEIEGLTHPGGYAPYIEVFHEKILGPRPLPDAVPVKIGELNSAPMHLRRVQFRGIIQGVMPPSSNDVAFWIADGPTELQVLCPSVPREKLKRLVDAQVLLTGVVGTIYNNRQQLYGPLLWLTGLEDIVVELPAPAVEALPVRRLRQYPPPEPFGHRIKIRGIVTYVAPEEFLCCHDGVQGVMIESDEATPVQPGDEIEALGFPEMGRYSPLLKHGMIRRVGHGTPPPPTPVTVSDILHGDHDINLVRLEAKLIYGSFSGREYSLFLKSDKQLFRAILPADMAPEEIDDLQPGSRLSIQGLCQITDVSGTLKTYRPANFQILLRSIDDISVLQAANWWTYSRLLWLLVGLLTVTVTAVAWSALLRRRVRQQSAIIRVQLQETATLEERQRVARELHDTLAQSFTGLVFQLDALDTLLAEAPAPARSQLTLARQIARHGQEEFRNSIHSLRARELLVADLPCALDELAQRVTSGCGLTVESQVRGTVRRLPEDIENHLLRMGQESVTNVARHANARYLKILWTFLPSQVELTIEDDGCGLDGHPARNSIDGHFGIRGMRERAEQLGARLTIDSPPGGGTRITIQLPLPSR